MRKLSLTVLKQVLNILFQSEYEMVVLKLSSQNALLTSFLLYTLLVCEPTPGDYILRKQIKYAFFDWRIMKEVV